MLQKCRIVTVAVLLLLALEALGIPPALEAAPFLISNRFSPYNKKRSKRPYTYYIVLHTTEDREKGSLREVVRQGLAHYFVTQGGRVYRIIDKSKIAKHAGRSMWEGHTTIDNYSIGIEVSGYHDKDITDAQYEALRELLRQLKSLYDITDENILTHSMVAYGRPNHFHKADHRGRRRCGMIFAKPEVRARLGLESSPKRDPDVESGRLIVADKELFKNLFPNRPVQTAVQTASIKAKPIKPAPSETVASEVPEDSFLIDSNRTAWEVARERYNHPSTVYVFPNGNRLTGSQIEDWEHIPAKTRVILNEGEDTQPFEGFLEIGKDGNTSKEIAGTSNTRSTTIYFFPDGLIRTGAELNSRRSTQKLLSNPPKETKVLIGYVYGGYVKSSRPPSSIAGVKWNYPSTYYRYPDGSIVSGDDIKDKEIPAGTLVFYQE
jgi:N-acetylmuramoyl-L-alanine amidase